jgi:hypothetical protein
VVPFVPGALAAEAQLAQCRVPSRLAADVIDLFRSPSTGGSSASLSTTYDADRALATLARTFGAIAVVRRKTGIFVRLARDRPGRADRPSFGRRRVGRYWW